MNMALYVCDLLSQINNPDLIMGGGDEFSSIRTFYRTPDQYSSKPNVDKKKKSEKLSYCHNPKRLRRHDN